LKRFTDSPPSVASSIEPTGIIILKLCRVAQTARQMAGPAHSLRETRAGSEFEIRLYLT
jgi:hypothetical protein